MQDGDIQELRATLRMDPDVYQDLLDEVRPGITKQHTNFRRPISAERRLAITLRFLALGDGFRSCAQQFRVGLSTSRNIVQETCQAIIRILGSKHLVTPSTAEEWLLIANHFEQRWNFPHCIGCVDGKHIRISQPKNSGSYYHNYKDFFSIVLMAIAGPDYKFLYVDIGAEGKASDGGIWTKTSFYKSLNKTENPLKIPGPSYIHGVPNRIPYVLLADDAFALSPNLLKPFPGSNLTRKQEIFNYRLSRGRRIIENVFGIMACRFRIFLKTIEVNPDFVSDIVMACCVLHNYLREKNAADYTPPGTFDQDTADGSFIPGSWREEINWPTLPKDKRKNASEYAKNVRKCMADYFVTREGEVDWQYNV